VRGEIVDVIVDLRSNSGTYLHNVTVKMTGENYRALYVPPGFAHGFQTLKDDTEILYMMNDYYDPDSSDGVRWNDPAFGIDWPIPDPPVISERDHNYPDFIADSFTRFADY
jgi:dTDP-4-dehydrorhamnose 3,5-epimerase